LSSSSPFITHRLRPVSSEVEVNAAVQYMNDADLDGRRIQVSIANARPSGGGGGGGECSIQGLSLFVPTLIRFNCS
jgi:hypothetical protein